MEIKNKNYLAKILKNRKFIALFLLFFILLIAFPIAKNAKKRYSINKEIDELNKEIGRIKENNQKLTKLVSYLNSDQYIEEQARLNFGLKKPGEKVYVIKNNNQADNSDNVQDSHGDLNNNQNGEKISNPRKWFNHFTKRKYYGK